MRLLEIITKRVLITTVLIIIQFTWFILFLMKLTSYSAWISAGFSTLSIIIVLYIIGKEEDVAYKIGWITLILALPLFGGLFYVFFGNAGPSKRVQFRLNKEHEKLMEFMNVDESVLKEIGDIDERAMGTCRYLQNKSTYPAYKNTAATYYPLGELMYSDMLKELEEAKHFIFLEYFIIDKGEMWEGILEILTRKAAEGVDVRLIYDDIGSIFVLPRSFCRELRKRGIKCMAFNQFKPLISLFMNNRDHRKIMVIDGHTAFNGGINLADEYINKINKYGHWKDTGVRLKGDAAWSFTSMFLEMWNAFHKNSDNLESFKPNYCAENTFKSDGYIQPYADSPLDHETVGENIYIEILAQAKRYVYIFTPYLIVDSQMRSALCMAAKRGVDVRIVTPGIPDKKIVNRLTRSNYPPLLNAGVKIYEYTAGFIHAKSYVCDDQYAVVGTVNMDYRSMHLHFECGTFLYRSASIMDLKQDALDTVKNSREVKSRDCRQGLFGKLFDAVLRIFAPLC
ncbi:cardiolipin synthase [Clostridium oryzae]|uniref:Cardiolipin synthase n=1 Tax=Clostridium oryzae TaxID=1450648 RepID=A0A1V4IEA8_9CLOT|nr:cardiolipin synthase [Clostridium oryzae]OPJ58180.1 cardiolipin synthase [Clostridium oryzae]